MSSKEVKAELKRAREAIKMKEFKEALKHCKNVLKLEKNNYNAWVFIGVSATELQQPDQALAAYRKATELEPEQLLAWQGLANLYEKSDQPDFKAELLKVYQSLSTLYEMSDKTKWFEVNKKLVEVYQSENNYLQVARVYQKLIQLKEGEERVKNSELLELLMEMIKVLQTTVENQDNETQQHLMLAFEKALELNVNVPSEAHKSLSENYIKCLSKLPTEFAKLKVICIDTLSIYPTYCYPLEALCEYYIKTGDCSEEAFCCSTRLLELDPENSVGHIGLGLKALLEKKYEDAIRSISLGLKQKCCSIIGWYSLSQAQLNMHKYTDSIISSSQGLKLSSDDWTQKLQRLKLKALVRTGRHQDAEEALQILAQISDVKNDPMLLALEGRALLQKGQTEKAFQVSVKLLSSYPDLVEGLTLKGLIHNAHNEHKHAEESFQEALSRSPDNAEILFLLGSLYWHIEEETQRDHRKSYTYFLKAAKLDPYLCSVFRFLGHYYRDVAKDQNRAKGCYKRAFELDSSDAESGAAAVDLSMEQGDMVGALTVLQSVTERSAPGSDKWAWLRRGLYYLKIGQNQHAVADLQAALRADPQDWVCWECLGEAYLNRRSFTAALKAFAKAHALHPTSIYSLYQTASIKQILGRFKEAAVEYKEILEQDDYVPALKGLGECLLALAKSALEDYLDGRAIDLIQNSIQYLFRAVKQRPDLSCLWKLLGDAFTTCGTVSPNQARVLVPGALCGMSPPDQSYEMDQQQLLAIGERCFGHALKLIPEIASLWCDLGLNYYHQFRLLSFLSKDDSHPLLEKALQCIKKAVMLDSTNHTYWNTLGVVALKKGIENFALAQHSFIKSVTAELNNVVAWTNLGALYLKKGNIELAHEAFKTAQSLEPQYVNCWIGQALIAETVGSYETMDLFRHTTELSTHTEGVKAYAYCVCSTLLDKSNKNSELYLYNIVQMNAVLAAQVVLTKYTERIQTDPDAFIMLGYLSIHLQLKNQATDAYRRAVELLRELPYTEKLGFTLRSYGCALHNNSQYEEALRNYSLIPKKTLNDLLGLALTYFISGYLTESIQAYEKALAIASKEKEKVYILTALGLIQHRLNSMDNAKTLLFKCSMVNVPVPESLQCLCALGLVHGDLTLASATLNELIKMGEKPIGGAVDDCCLLFCTLLALQGNYSGVHREASRAIHRNPGNPSLWALLSRLVPQYCPNKADGGAVAGCVACHASLTLGKRALLYSGLNHLATGRHSRKDRKQNALKTIQRAVLLCPEDPAGWAGLMAACHTENTASLLTGSTCHRKNLERSLMTLVSEKVKGLQEEDELLAQVLEGWVLQQAVTGFKQSGQYDEAEALCSKVLSVSPEHPVVFLMLRQVQCEQLLLSETGNDIPPAVINQLSAAVMAIHTSVSAWHWLAEVYRSQDLLTQASMAYRQSLQLASQLGDYNGKISSLLRLALLALIPCRVDSYVSQWQDLVLEACAEVLKIGSSPVTLLIQALLQFFVKLGGRETRRLLERIVYASPSGTSDTVLSVARWYLLRHLHLKDNLELIDNLLMIGSAAGDNRLLEFYRRIHPSG